MDDIFNFNDSSTVSAVDMLKANCRVILVDGSPVVEFKTNQGKGSGPQRVALSELSDFRDTLAERIEAGEGEAIEQGYIPAPILLARSFRLVKNPGTPNKAGDVLFGGEDYYEWNSNTGKGNASKGSKPAKVPVSQMPAFMELFSERTEAIIEKAIERGLLEPEEDSEVDLDAID